MKLHSCFYDQPAHRNTHQPHWLIPELGKRGFKYIRYILVAMSLWPLLDPLSREAHLVMVICTIWMSVIKRVLKNFVNMLRIRAALRPPNEAFPRGLYFGGFPSGHVSQAFMAVVAVYYVWGPNLLVYALICQTMLTAIWVICTNRHYVSQVIAGLCLGTVYAYASLAWVQAIYGPDIFHSRTSSCWGLL